MTSPLMKLRVCDQLFMNLHVTALPLCHLLAFHAVYGVRPAVNIVTMHHTPVLEVVALIHTPLPSNPSAKQASHQIKLKDRLSMMPSNSKTPTANFSVIPVLLPVPFLVPYHLIKFFGE